MSAKRPDPDERRVIPFRQPHPRAGNDNRPGALGPSEPSIGDLSRFERDQSSHDDHRDRMLVNGLAFLVCLFLVLGGIWLADRMAQMRKDQDCVLSGRRGCTPVDVPVRSRW